MFKQFLKACLVSITLLGVSLPATAEITPGGSFVEYYGQVDTGVDGEEAYFDSIGQANINITGTLGPITAFIDVEVDDDNRGYYGPENTVTATDSNGDTVSVSIPNNRFNDDASRWIQYTNGGFSVKLGTIDNLEPLGYSIFGGTKTFNIVLLGGSAGAGLSGGYSEADGIRIGYKTSFADIGLTIQNTVEEMSAYEYTTYFYNTYNQLSLLGEGQVNQLTANGMAGPVMWSVAYTTTKTDDPTDPDDEAQTGTIMKAGAIIFLQKEGTMGLMLDWSQATAQVETPYLAVDAGEWKSGETGMQFFMGIGPGTIKLSYSTGSASYDGEATGAAVWQNLVYDIPLDKGVGAQLVYTSVARTPEGGDTTTTTYTAGGLYASF